MRVAGLVVLSLLTLGGSRSDAGVTGKLCFARPADEGAMNRHAVRVWGEQAGHRRKLVELKGGGKDCVRLALGQWSLEARSSRLGAPASADPNACRSAPLVLDVTKTGTVGVSVSPLGRAGATYDCGWNLE